MNAYEKAIELGLTGDPEEIVAALRATGLTERKISLAYLTDLLRTRKMLTKLSYEDPETKMKWSGSVIHMIVTLRDSGHPALPAVNQWFGHVTDPRAEYFDTSLPEFAAPFWLLSQSVAGVDGMPSTEDFAAVAALGGGWLYADLTVEQFAEQKSAAETRVQAAAERQAAVDRMTVLLTTAQTLAASRATARQLVIQPLLNAGIRDDEFLKNMQAQIGFATNGGGYVEITQEDVDAMLGGA